MDEEKLKLLYDAVSQDYDIGTYEDFQGKFQDPNKRKAFYDGVGKEYELGTYDEFEAKVMPPKVEQTSIVETAGETALNMGTQPVMDVSQNTIEENILSTPKETTFETVAQNGQPVIETEKLPYDQWLKTLDPVTVASDTYDLEKLYEDTVNRGDGFIQNTTALKKYAKPNNPLFTNESNYYGGKKDSDYVSKWERAEDGTHVLRVGKYNKETVGIKEIIDAFMRTYSKHELVDTDGSVIYKNGEVSGEYEKYFLYGDSGKIDPWESIENTVSNIGKRLSGFDDRLAVLSADTWEKVLGKDLAKKLYEIDPISPRDIDQVRLDAYTELEKLDEEVKTTQDTFEAIRSGNVVGVATGIFDLMGNVASSAPLAIGGGALLVADFGGDFIRQYNVQKADNLGIGIKELYETGQADYLTPVGLSVAASLSERMGLKAVGDTLLQGLTSKSGIAIGKLLGNVSREGGTEWFQYGLEEARRVGADPNSTVEDMSLAFGNALTSKEGVKRFLYGAIATLGVAGVGKLSRLAILPKNKLNLSEELTKVNLIEMELRKPELSEEARTTLENQKEQSVEVIGDLISETATEEQNIPTERTDEIRELSTKIDELDAVINDPSVSNEVKNSLSEQKTEIAEQIESITDSESRGAKLTSVSDVNIGDRITLEGGRTGVVENIEGESVKIKMERGGILTANPTLVEMSKVEPQQIITGVLRKELDDFKSQPSTQKLNFSDALDRVSEKEELNDIQKATLDKFKEILQDVNVYSQEDYFFKGDSPLVGEDGYGGTIDLDTNDILLFKSGNFEYHSIIHEATHLLTAKSLDSRFKEFNKDFRDEVELYFEQAKSKLGEDENYSYAFSNLDEFVSETFGNPDFQAELSYIEGISGKKTNLFKSIIEAIRKLVKSLYDFDIPQSLLEDILVATEKNINRLSPPEIIVETTIATPTQEKLTEIQTRRAETSQRLRSKLSNLNSGINPDALKDLVELGVTYIEEGVVRFKDFAERVRTDLGKDLKDEDLRSIYKQSAEALGYGVRGFTERVRTDETTPEATRQALDETEQLYQKQDYDEIANRLAQMDEGEKQRLVGSLESVTSQLSSDQNIGVLAGIELINKYNAEGRTEEASRIIESLSKSATVAAQTLRQYGEFKTSTPDGYVQLVEKWMAKANKKLTEAQKTKIQELFNIQQQQSQNVTEALETVTENLTDDNYKDYYSAVIEYEDAIRKLEDYVDTVRGKTLTDTLGKILQGNLLSFKSVVINPFANAVQFGVRGAENDVATAIDQVVSLITSRRTKSATLTADNIRLGGRGVVEGVRRANRKAIRGTANSELSKYDVGGRLKPAVAWRRLFDNIKSSDLRKENQYGWEQGLSDFAEGTLGVPANIMFRLLPYGDDPFFEQAKVQRLVEIGKNDKGLEGEALERFVLRPDKSSAESADQYGREATFQEENVISRNINRLINDGARRIEALGGRQGAGAYRFIMKGILPFVNTPSSIALKTVKFAVPAIPLAQAVNDGVQLRKALKMSDSSLKEKRIIEAQRNFSNHMGEAIISGTVLTAATILVANGLATGDLPEDQFQKKQKDFMFATQPPNTINISGVERLLRGEDSTYRQGDKTISYVPLGLLGAQIGIVSSTRGSELREAKKRAKVRTTEGEAYYPETDVNPLNFVGNFLTNAPAAMRYFFNQSFVQGAETVLNAVSTENGARNIVPQLGKTFVTMGIPNTVSQSFRASNDYMRDLYTDDQVETFANIIKEKVGNVEDLPIKYDLWGKPIKQNPEGTNPFVYQVLDIFRTQKILQDPITYAVFDLQRRSGDDAPIPSSVDDTFNKKDIRVKLTKEQKSELTKSVGEERRKLAERILKSYKAGESDPEKYIPRLKKAYEAGAKRALAKFKKKYLNKKQDAEK